MMVVSGHSSCYTERICRGSTMEILLYSRSCAGLCLNVPLHSLAVAPLVRLQYGRRGFHQAPGGSCNIWAYKGHAVSLLMQHNITV